jgi:hypothetical protein
MDGTLTGEKKNKKKENRKLFDGGLGISQAPAHRCSSPSTLLKPSTLARHPCYLLCATLIALSFFFIKKKFRI